MSPGPHPARTITQAYSMFTRSQNQWLSKLQSSVPAPALNAAERLRHRISSTGTYAASTKSLCKSTQCTTALVKQQTQTSRLSAGKTQTGASLQNPWLVKSEAPVPPPGSRLIRTWCHLKLKVKAGVDGPDMTVVPDSGAGMTLADKGFATENFSRCCHCAFGKPEPYGGVGLQVLVAKEVAYITLYIPSVLPTGQRCYALWRIRTFVVDYLKPNMLLGIDTLEPQGVILDLRRREMIQMACKSAAASLQVMAKSSDASKARKVYAVHNAVIPAFSVAPVKVRTRKPLAEDVDYNLRPLLRPSFRASVAHSLMSATTDTTLIRNDTSKDVVVQRNAPVGHAVPATEQSIGEVEPETICLAFMPEPREALKEEVTMPNGVTVYGTPSQTLVLSKVVMHHPGL